MLLVGLTDCATGVKLDTAGVDRRITPELAVEDIERVGGSEVLWGGIIINTTNLKDETQIEVLDYPLEQRSQRPLTSEPPRGRFLVVHPGYLEAVDYAQGRLLTVTGQLTETRHGKVGEAAYRYPVVEATAMHLWPKERVGIETEPRFHIGVGVIFGD